MNPPINKIICGDCSEVLLFWCDESVDLTVTSPPYDELRDYKGYSFDFEKTARQLYRVTKTGGIVVWVVGDQVIDGSESGNSFRQALYFKECGFNLHDTMIYEKNGALPDNCRYFQVFEYMFILSKGRPKTVNFIEDRKNRFKERWGKGRCVREKDGSLTPRDEWKGRDYGRRNNIWRYNTGAGYSSAEEIAFDIQQHSRNYWHTTI
jgi:DNA modification methylase